MTSIRCSRDGKTSVIRDLGGERAGMEWEMGEFLNLLGLSTSAEDEQAAGETDAEKDENDKGDKELRHGWGHCCAVARVASGDECGNNRHC